MNTSVRPNRPDAVVGPTPPILQCGAPSDLQHCVGRVPTTSLRSLRVCDSSFAAISNHSIQVARKTDLIPAPLLLTISQPQSAGPDPAAKIVCLQNQESKNQQARRAFSHIDKPTDTNFQQHHRTAKHSVQKPNTSSHSEAITHTPPLTNPPSPHCQSRT